MGLIDYLSEIYEAVNKLKLRNSDRDNYVLAFRGEACDYGTTKLMPSIFRNPGYVEKERYLFELIDDYGMGKGDKCSNIEKLIETQHYIAISRLLDISFNSLVALYFACKHGSSNEQDGRIYVFLFPEYFSPHSGYLEEFYTKILNGENNFAYFRNFKVITHSYSNERIKAQNGGFIFFPGNKYCPMNQVYYEQVEIRGADKSKVLEDLDVMFQINDATIFPEVENIARLVTRKFEKGGYKKNAASIEDEVCKYLQRISYEVDTLKKMSYSSMDLLRRLRKEEDDIKNFLFYQKTINGVQETYDSLLDEVEKEFNLIRKLI